ncbi:MAG: PPC domain-containing DNA-binding protein [Spirochaetota bacterium]
MGNNMLQVLRLQKDDNVKEQIIAFVERNGWNRAIVTGALGSVVGVTVGNAKTLTIPPEVNYTSIEGPFEILSFAGEVTNQEDGTWFAHIHMAGSKADATVFGGGMQDATVFKGLQVFLTEA